jgi:molybdopterin molybdotransferase
MSLPSVDEARARILEWVSTLPSEQAALAASHGRVLAEAIDAVRHQPPFDASAMDGWAIRAADAAGEANLIIAGESAAGRSFPRALAAGEAVRIFTGAAVPEGADAVVIQEEAERIGDRVRLGPYNGKDNIRRRGGDFQAGDRLLSPGERLDAWRISLAAAAGRAHLTVSRRPRVAFLSTGEELAAPGTQPRPDQIFESGSVSLMTLATAWGAEACRLATGGDDEARIAASVEHADVEVLVTIGGASVGDYDLVKPALRRLGLELQVESVNMRPGKPTWFGRLADGRLVMGLPGNPNSAFVCAELFLRPMLRKMQGAEATLAPVWARLGESLPANGPREHLMRAALTHTPDGALEVRAFSEQDSSLVSVLARADALIHRASHAAAAAKGQAVPVMLLGRL